MSSMRESRALTTSAGQQIQVWLAIEQPFATQPALAGVLIVAASLHTDNGHPESELVKVTRTDGGGDPELDPDPAP